MIQLPTFLERFEYAKIPGGKVCDDTFGYARYINQNFYRSLEWKRLRDKIIIRDTGCDLGVGGYEIPKRALIHHLNPVTKQQLLDNDPMVWDPENLITVSFDTHQAIHYGDYDLVNQEPVTRSPFDTCPWKAITV